MVAQAPRKRANQHDPTTAAFTEAPPRATGCGGQSWSAGRLMTAPHVHVTQTGHPRHRLQFAAAAVLLEEGVEGAEERHAHESSRSYCFGVPVTIASSSQASTRY